MNNLVKLLKEVELVAQKENKIFGPPVQYEAVIQKGQELASRLHADRLIVNLGTILMDVKIGQALKEGKPQEHIKMSLVLTRGLLNKFKVTPEEKRKILNCIEAHHRTVPYLCLEAEICANADCFRFLSVKGFLTFIHGLGKRGMSFSEAIDYARRKLEEKHKIISLKECRKEAEDNYRLLKKLVNLCKIKKQN